MKKKPIKFNLEQLSLGLILLFGFFLRVYHLGKPGFWIDESISTIASSNILVKGFPVFDSGVFYSRAYLFHYLQAFFLIFQKSDFFARIPSVIAGVLIIFLAYKIGKEYSKSAGIFAALFTSIFYLEVFFSRQARFYALFQLMFFLSLFLLYKSKNNNRYLYLSLISLFITLNLHLAGFVLIPFFIIHILLYNKNKRYFALIPTLPLLQKFLTVSNLPADSASSAVNYASRYLKYATNWIYLIVLFVLGTVWSFKKNKRLTFLIVTPSLILIIGVFTIQTFALRYVFLIVFPLVLYSSLLLSFLYEKYGKLILIAILILIIFPSNLVFPYTYVNILSPVDYSLYDNSAPQTPYKDLPLKITTNLKKENTILISFFSSDVQWYLKKPNYVIPFSMDGRGSDQISHLNKNNKLVDIYSGSPILTTIPNETFYVLEDSFSTSKLKPTQRENLKNITQNCTVYYSAPDLTIHKCLK